MAVTQPKSKVELNPLSKGFSEDNCLGVAPSVECVWKREFERDGRKVQNPLQLRFAILVSILILVITVKWGEIPRLVELITFALTLTSLVLAALAIAYAVYSNSSFSQNISTLNNVSRDVSVTSNEISKAALELAEKIESIPSKLESMETKVEQTHRLLLQVSEKRDDGQAAEPERPAVDKIVDHFLEICSISGLIALYASSVAYSKGVPFKLDDLLSKIKYVESIYVQGFLTATTGAGLITSTMNKDIINVTFVEDKITQTVRQLLIDRAMIYPMKNSKQK